MLGLEALTGTLDDFGFEDYLNGIKCTLSTKEVIFCEFYCTDLSLDNVCFNFLFKRITVGKHHCIVLGNLFDLLLASLMVTVLCPSLKDLRKVSSVSCLDFCFYVSAFSFPCD